MRPRVEAAFVPDALPMALRRRPPTAGLIHHAERGSPDACGIYHAWLATSGIRCRMSRQGDGLDHAVAERVCGRLKRARPALRPDANRPEAWDDSLDSLEMFDNRTRFHAYVGYVRPHHFERVARVASLSVRFYLTTTREGGGHRSVIQMRQECVHAPNLHKRDGHR